MASNTRIEHFNPEGSRAATRHADFARTLAVRAERGHDCPRQRSRRRRLPRQQGDLASWNQTKILQEETVSEHVYKKIELIGSSPNSIDEAIEGAISRASKTTRNLDWFEVDQIRGQIVNGKVAHYQVVMKVGFRIDD
jgi:flavin-binding protein dodecin